MSDLSRLLDDVYGTTPAPSWTAEAAEVFSGWVPDAAPVEKPRLELVPDPVEALEAILDLGAVERARAAEPAVEPAPVVDIRPWVPSDDDVLPGKATRRRLSFRLR